MATRVTYQALRNEGFRAGAEMAATIADKAVRKPEGDRFLERITIANMVLAGWLLVGLGLVLNAIEFFAFGRAPVSFSGIVFAGVAIVAVYFGMHCTINSASRTFCFIVNVLATVASLGCWLALNKHLWGL